VPRNPTGNRSSGWLGWLILLIFLLGASLCMAPLCALAQDPQATKANKPVPQAKKTNSSSAGKTTQGTAKRPSSAATKSSPKATPSPGSIGAKGSTQLKQKSEPTSKASSTTSTKGRGQTKKAGQANGLEPFRAAVVMDAATGHVVYAHDPHKRLVPASLTKMMLVLVVMERVKAGKLRLSEPVTASERTSGIGGTQIDLKPGEALPLEEMLQAILVRSANDAAATVAEHVSGSQASFVELMNARARSLGMFDTVFSNVHGLPDPHGHDNVSSAYDMAILAKALLRFPEILHWSSQEVAYIRGGRYPIHSTNKLLGRCQGVDGLKTGFVRKAGFNIAATATREDRRLIAVVMGSPSSETRNNAAANLLSQGFESCQNGATSVRKDSSSKEARRHSSSSAGLPTKSPLSRETRS
jgi:D-alanyl-D-alanine carboxypeptidase